MSDQDNDESIDVDLYEKGGAESASQFIDLWERLQKKYDAKSVAGGFVSAFTAISCNMPDLTKDNFLKIFADSWDVIKEDMDAKGIVAGDYTERGDTHERRDNET